MFLFCVENDVFGNPTDELEKRLEGRRCLGKPSRVGVRNFFRRHLLLVQSWRQLLTRVEDDHLCYSLEYGKLSGRPDDTGFGELCEDGLFSQRCLVFQALGRCEKVACCDFTMELILFCSFPNITLIVSTWRVLTNQWNISDWRRSVCASSAQSAVFWRTFCRPAPVCRRAIQSSLLTAPLKVPFRLSTFP